MSPRPAGSKKRARLRQRQGRDSGDRKTESTDAGTELPPPPGIEARTVVLDHDEYLVLTVPIPRWDIPERLTDAEREITIALLQGATNEQIARERHTSIHTVANQIASIFGKLGVTSRIELAHRLGSKARGE